MAALPERRVAAFLQKEVEPFDLVFSSTSVFYCVPSKSAATRTKGFHTCSMSIFTNENSAMTKLSVALRIMMPLTALEIETTTFYKCLDSPTAM